MMENNSMEVGRLSHGNMYGVDAMDAIDFIVKRKISETEKIICAQFLCDRRLLKPEPNRVRYVAGGDKLYCFIDSGAPTTNIIEI